MVLRMTRHGVSPAAAALTCTIASGPLVMPLDVHIPWITSLVGGVARRIVTVVDLSWTSAAVSWLIVGAALEFLRGMAFAWRRR